MTREIKFRAMTVSPGKGREHRPEMVYGSLVMKPGNDAKIHWYEKNRKGIEVRRNRSVDYKTVGQLTGIKDSHGNDLYADDVCWNPQDETWGKVVWDEGAWCYQWENVIENLHDCWYLIELRGNIHENPDLLERVS